MVSMCRREKSIISRSLGLGVKTIKHQGQKGKVAKGRMLKTTNILQRGKEARKWKRKDWGVRNRKEEGRRLESDPDYQML